MKVILKGKQSLIAAVGKRSVHFRKGIAEEVTAKEFESLPADIQYLFVELADKQPVTDTDPSK